MDMITCPACNAQVPMGAAFCDRCGTPLAGSSDPGLPLEGELRCPQCKNVVAFDDTFCRNCGALLTGAGPSSVEHVPGLCPNCHAAVRIGDLFCDHCGYSLKPDAAPPPSSQRPAESIVVPAVTPEGMADMTLETGPRLIIQPGGIALTLEPGKDNYVIGREDPSSGSYPDVDLVPFGGEEGGVSRRHAQITRDGESYSIEDLNSVNYTFVNKKKIAVGVEHPLLSGDEIRLGRVLLRFETS